MKLEKASHYILQHKCIVARVYFTFCSKIGMGRIICCAFAYLNEYKYLNTVAYIIMMYISNSKCKEDSICGLDINFSNVIVI